MKTYGTAQGGKSNKRETCDKISKIRFPQKSKTHIDYQWVTKLASPLWDGIGLKSLINLVTTGCNIPLFISGISDRQCFNKPNDQFKWDNYYDPDDVLGWPLRQLSNSFNIVKDHDINAGGLFTSWNPLSHLKYWSDKDVINPLADILKNLLP